MQLAAILDILVGLAQAPISVVQDPARMRPGDLEVVWGDSTRLREATGWSPEIELEQTLNETLDYARQAVIRAART